MPRVKLDWGRLRAVVIESDDWGLCAWVPDEQARRVLHDTPVFRSAAGRRYGGSTLESAADLRQLGEILAGVEGGDGQKAVWQANTIVASPDYAQLRPPRFDVNALPLVALPDFSGRWSRPGLWEEIRRVIALGLWSPELHGLHHLPEQAWLTALRRGEDDARRAFDQLSPLCAAVEASSEYDASEPPVVRDRNLTLATERFAHLFGRPPGSFCPPDYRWDDRLESQSERLGIPALQGKSEQHGASWARLRRLWHRSRFPRRRGRQLLMPPRILFEPRIGDARFGVEAAHRAVREAWTRRQPAVLGTHRVNYVHLDTDSVASGRAALRDLLGRLAADGAIFVTDAEITQLVARGWSCRDFGDRGVLVRVTPSATGPVRLDMPSTARGARFVDTRDDAARLAVSGRAVEVQAGPGVHRIDWSRT